MHHIHRHSNRREQRWIGSLEYIAWLLTALQFCFFFFISYRECGIQIIMLIVDAVYLFVCLFFNLSYLERNVMKLKKPTQRRKLKVHESVQRSLKGDTWSLFKAQYRASVSFIHQYLITISLNQLLHCFQREWFGLKGVKNNVGLFSVVWRDCGSFFSHTLSWALSCRVFYMALPSPTLEQHFTNTRPNPLWPKLD